MATPVAPNEIKEPMPTAPQTPFNFDGYQNLGFVAVQNQNFELKSDPNVSRPNFQNVPYLSEDEAKEALAKYVSEHCCYGKSPIKQMVFNNLQSSNTYRYVLQTYTETRSTAYASEPYLGAPIYVTGQPVQPWDIQVQPKILFNNEIVKVEIPNTARVENCSSCMGVGNKLCYTCNGRGSKICWICNGRGRREVGHVNQSYDTFNHNQHHNNHNDQHHHHHHDQHEHHHSETCYRCSGTGYELCTTCNRSGRIQCGSCSGSGKLKWFIQLTVTFQNNEDDYLKRSDIIPDDLLRTCQGQNIFSEQNIRLHPISHHSEAEINQASFNLLNSHASKFSTSRIIAQRHDVLVIPVTLCVYTWKDKQHKYHIYGIDQKVFAPEYPNKCCCSIL